MRKDVVSSYHSIRINKVIIITPLDLVLNLLFSLALILLARKNGHSRKIDNFAMDHIVHVFNKKVNIKLNCCASLSYNFEGIKAD